MSIQVVSLLIGTVLPILVGVVTTRATNPGVKAVLLALLSALSAVGTDYLGSAAGFDWKSAGLTALATFATGVAVHFGLWKPTGVAQFVQQSVGRTDGKA